MSSVTAVLGVGLAVGALLTAPRLAAMGWPRASNGAGSAVGRARRSAAETLSRGWGRERGPRAASDLIALRTALAAGATVAQAFEQVAAGDGPRSGRAAEVSQRLARGLPLADALDDWAASDRSGAAGLLTDALALAGTTGGSQLRAVDAAIETVRGREALAREVRALASQAQASAVVMVLAPAAFGVALALIDDRVRGFYVRSAAGWACVLGGAALDVLGAIWMARLVRSVR